MHAYFYDLFLMLGIFIPLIVTNCAIIGRAEAFASRNSPWPSLLDGFATGLGFCITLVLLGALRELSGRGTLLTGADMLFGEWGQYLALTIIPEHPGFLLAMLPPGAFFCLALLIAARNAWEARETNKHAPARQLVPDSHEV